MDPQATWSQLQTALRVKDLEAVHELAESLLLWLERGGFPPATGQGNPHDAAQQRANASRFCRSALQQIDADSPTLCDCVRPHA